MYSYDACMLLMYYAKRAEGKVTWTKYPGIITSIFCSVKRGG